MCSTQLAVGEMLAIMTVRAVSPTKLSRSTAVSLLPLNGTWRASLSRALMHSLSASRLLLISAPSRRVWRLLSNVSAPRSLPARSMKLILPTCQAEINGHRLGQFKRAAGASSSSPLPLTTVRHSEQRFTAVLRTCVSAAVCWHDLDS